MGSGPSLPTVKLPNDTVVVVTGGNTGIGYEKAKELAVMGAQVVLACRSEQRATEAIARMKAEFESDKYKRSQSHSDDRELHVEYMALDLASLKSTMDFINAFKQSGRKLHILMCNAGIAAPQWGHTEDGYEPQFQVKERLAKHAGNKVKERLAKHAGNKVNYLGHFLIIAHLLPIMQQSGDDCRIILTSSEAAAYGTFDIDTIQAEEKRSYGRFQYYCKSKMYQIMQTITMAPRLAGSHVSLTCYHPGAVATEIARNSKDHPCYCCVNLMHCCLRRPEQGAKTGLYLAISPDVKGQSGGYYANCRLKTPSRTCRNTGYQEQLWTYTMTCLKDLLPDDFS